MVDMPIQTPLGLSSTPDFWIDRIEVNEALKQLHVPSMNGFNAHTHTQTHTHTHIYTHIHITMLIYNEKFSFLFSLKKQSNMSHITHWTERQQLL
jgi:hypothetical protein